LASEHACERRRQCVRRFLAGLYRWKGECVAVTGGRVSASPLQVEG